MRRRIVWRYGDSSPVFGHLVTSVDPSGDGEIKIITGFPVSAAIVSFASSYNRWLIDQYQYGYGYENYSFSPTVHVSAVDDDGFYVCYQNIADLLDINYYVT